MKKIVAWITGIILLLCMASPAFAAKKDTVCPTITGSYPYDFQGNVMADCKLMIRFNEVIQKGRSITLLKIMDVNDKFVACSYELKDNIMQLWPKKKLDYGTEYRVVIPAHAVKDVSGNELEKEQIITFYTESKTAANGSVIQEQEEVGKSTHTIEIDVAMRGSLKDAEKAYIIAAFQSFGVQVNHIRVSDAEENTEEKPEEMEEVTEEEAVEAEEEVEYAEFDLYLVEPGPWKIQMVQFVRQITTLGLREAKDLVDGTLTGPKLVKEGISSEEAESCADRIEELRGVPLIVGHGESPY